MTKKRFLDSRVVSILASFGMLLGVAAPAAIPAFASADTLASRSIEMSNGSVGKTGVEYFINFTPSDDIGDVAIDFCTTPYLDTTCTRPGTTTQFTALTAQYSVADSNLSQAVADTDPSTTALTATHVTVTGGTHDGTATTIALTGITNSDDTNVFYARIYAYSGTSDWTAADDIGSPQDSGAVAIQNSNSVGVSASVPETMSFCVSKTEQTAGCGGTYTAPDITLGNGNGVLDSSTLSTADVYAQLNTNAVHGGTVYIKSGNTNCGGLSLVTNLATCPIAAADGNTVALGASYIGVKAVAGTLTGHGALEADSSYGTNYNLVNSEVIGAYGSPIFDSTNAPVDNSDMKLTFAASIDGVTPAGSYSNSYSLIAVGTF